MSEPDRLFEQYKLAVEMADRISARRGAANAFFATGNAALLASIESFDLVLAPVIGIVFVCAWWVLLRSYRQLNSVKWEVINELEANLPAQPFAEEWKRIKKKDALERRFGRYAELSVVEQVVPLLFLGLYLVQFGQALS